MTKAATCRECGAPLKAQRNGAEFCSAACRTAFHNRRARRGADFYDVVMCWRFDRAGATAAGAMTLLSRMAAAFKADDDREHAGRKSWDDIAKAKERNPYLMATVVGHDVAGLRRPGGRA